MWSYLVLSSVSEELEIEQKIHVFNELEKIQLLQNKKIYIKIKINVNVRISISISIKIRIKVRIRIKLGKMKMKIKLRI